MSVPATDLIGTFGDRAYRLALRITRNAADAEEIVQDAFCNVIRKVDTLRGDSAFRSWLYRIVGNAAYQKVRGTVRRRVELSLDEVADLPTDYHTVVLWHDVEGLSTADIAAAPGISVADVKSRLHRARLFLRKRLTEAMTA